MNIHTVCIAVEPCKGNEEGRVTINACDFDPDKHDIVVEPSPEAIEIILAKYPHLKKPNDVELKAEEERLRLQKEEADREADRLKAEQEAKLAGSQKPNDGDGHGAAGIDSASQEGSVAAGSPDPQTSAPNDQLPAGPDGPKAGNVENTGNAGKPKGDKKGSAKASADK